MGIEIGQTLDRYELLEKVGQGGMAVVYRGRDQALKREVAIKVLHRHLADHEEARDRFEREAQAVAKLRHENILEIFDYSNKSEGEAYIVTEFIAGQTLKQFTGEHRIEHPEIGAMIAVQVCRALVHAHAFGVLHRDVKPENIMIRTDGVVKLTDFGIAQMLDVQRLTVTGQLLGSPAYMSPEHVEGKPLDVRTDVFAVGIVLYQLVTGQLPFRGRNAHEILKRIAEGKFDDPNTLEPRVGGRLGGILRCTLARDPDERYADVPTLLAALEGYLAECGLAEVRPELAGFFAAPAAYQAELTGRLCATLAAAGHAALGRDRNAALELWNRVLTLRPDHPEVCAAIDRLSRRARGRKLAAACAVVGLLGGGAIVWRTTLDPGGPSVPARPTTVAAGPGRVEGQPVSPREPGVLRAASPAEGDEGADGDPIDPPIRPAPDTRAPPRRDPERPPRRPSEPDPIAAPPGARRTVTLRVTPAGSEISVAGGPWRVVPTRATVELPTERTEIRARNADCCSEATVTVAAGDTGARQIDLDWLPGNVVPRCDRPGVTATVDDRPMDLGATAEIPITSVTGRARVQVRFTDGEYLDEQTVDVRYKDSKVVACRG